MTFDLFTQDQDLRVPLGAQAWWLRGLALPQADALVAAARTVQREAVPRRMQTPGGQTMQAALTNCGARGWVSDSDGYRYSPCDPLTGLPWPAMPALFLELAQRAAQAAGFDGYVPDACLINHYGVGAGMGLHQDRDERDLAAPIVSVSLGWSATFLWGGLRRRDPTQSLPLSHGDVLVWGGIDRLRYHGVRPLTAQAAHPLTGAARLNLTFRCAG